MAFCRPSSWGQRKVWWTLKKTVTLFRPHHIHQHEWGTCLPSFSPCFSSDCPACWVWLLPCWPPHRIIWNPEEPQSSVTLSASPLHHHAPWQAQSSVFPWRIPFPAPCPPLPASPLSLGMVRPNPTVPLIPHSCQSSPETRPHNSFLISRILTKCIYVLCSALPSTSPQFQNVLELGHSLPKLPLCAAYSLKIPSLSNQKGALPWGSTLAVLIKQCIFSLSSLVWGNGLLCCYFKIVFII